MLRSFFVSPLLLGLLVAFPAHAGYNTCGTTIVSSSTRTCSDGIIAMYHSGDPFTVSSSSVDFGNVEVGQTSTRTIMLSNNSGYSLGFSGSISVSSAFAAGSSSSSSSDCGTTLANGGTCTINLKFAPSAAGVVSGQVQIPVTSATSPYTIAVKGTGVVAATPVAPVAPVVPVTPNPPAPAQPTHATKTMPTSCISYIGGTTLMVPYFTFNGTPMWGKFTSTGSLVSYQLSDYGALTGTPTSTCTADGGKLNITTSGATMPLAHLLYNNNFYTATLQLVGMDKDGFFLFNIVAADVYRAPSNPPNNPSTPSIDHSILVGNWALHNGMSTVTFKDDGTYSSANGGTGTYRWEGDRLFVNGALTSGRDMEVTLEIAASATWLHVDLDVSGYTVRSSYYKMK